MKKYIHETRRTGRDQPLMPVITIKNEGKSNVYCNAVAIKGESRVIYGHDKALLPCGARVIIETDAEVEILE